MGPAGPAGSAGPAGPAGPAQPDISVAFHDAEESEQIDLDDNVLTVQVGSLESGFGTPQSLSGLAGYPGLVGTNGPVVHVSEAIEGDQLYVDAVTSNGQAAQLICTLSGTTGLEGGATSDTACISVIGHAKEFWHPLVF